ncbi:hypothetical protein VNO78_24258 [Psophocarpus tetragonolobus]|uniref:Leucine-rich repeat-containing N-terminal plant-type domain-containing protein n=1 Tax=Psophocarpus tetragonolobus TaxID=3891 RepID=A0AAN9S5T0_PSOTE
MRTTSVSLLSCFLCYYLIYLSICFSVASAKCFQDEQLLLLQLQNNLTFKLEHSTKLKLWNQSIDCCNWSGVTCDDEGHVIGLDLSGELITGGFDDSSAVFSLQHLQTLRASNTSFFGQFPHSIGNMRHLSVLDFSYCQFNGTLPYSLSNLTELSYLDLSFNNFTGQIPSFDMAKKLRRLDLSHNGLSGAIPSSLFTLPLLQRIQLSHNQFNQLDEFINVSSSILNTLDLSNNDLLGPFPTSIFLLSKLSVLLLSSNEFSGSIHLNKLFKLEHLTTLDLSYSKLSVNVNVTNVVLVSFPNFRILRLASCSLKTFPGFLRNQSKLAFLDLSDNQIQGIVPNWIWKLQNLQSLNISHNLLTHLEGPLHNITSKLSVLDLHLNKFQGPIPVFLENAIYLDYSSNKFSSLIPRDIGNYLSFTVFLSLSNNTLHGNIPTFLCNASYLEVLDLSINNISGTIPSCLMKMSKTLRVLNLRNNSITGPIPDTFPASNALRTLDLHQNKLDGKIPKSLANCIALEVLDLGRNNIADVFPCFLKNISTLRVLVLQKNKLYGNIGCPNTNGIWQMLQVVDLSFNNFSGKIPGKSFTRWKAMISDENKVKSISNQIWFQFQQLGEDIYYQDSVNVKVINEDVQLELVKFFITSTSVDFSFNHFEGSIPEELMNFKSLNALNLSNNALSGKIPSSIGKLRNLESLDLSQNSLSGEIPMQLGSLSFLSSLNLSFNYLVGKIPPRGQLTTFPTSSFVGNVGLLNGNPNGKEVEDLLKGNPNGKEVEDQSQEECNSFSCKIDWNFISVEVGVFFGLGFVYAPLLLSERWKIWYWKLTHKILCCIFPQLQFEYVRNRGQTYTVLRWQH